MTISTTDSRVEYIGDGTTTAFAVPFYFLADGDLYVYQDGTLKTITTHYTVTGAGDEAGGTVTFVSAPNTGQEVVIVRDPAITQTTDYPANDPFPASSHERALDRLTMIAQRNRDLIDRSFLLADSDISTVDLTMPTPAANTTLMWNSDADGLTNGPTSDEVSNAQTYATQAAASATLAEQYLDDFEDIYLGAKAADPTLDNDGAALAAGMLYYNTVSGKMKIYNGAAWEDAVSADPVSITSETFSGDGAETAFTLSSAPSSVEFVEVFISGVRQVPTTDYTVASTTLTFTTPPALGTDNIMVRMVSAISAFTPADNSVSTAKIQDGAVTYAKIQDVSATKRALGRNTAGAGDAEEVTATQILDWLGTAAQGDLLYRNATDWVFLPKGTANQVLKMNSGATAPEWATQSTTGAWELASTTSVTAVGSIDFDLQEDVYCEWKFVGDNVIPVTDNSSLLFRMGYSNGSTFDTSNYTSTQIGRGVTSTNNTIVGCTGASEGVGTAAGETASFVLTISGISSSNAGGFAWKFESSWKDAAGDARALIGYGYYDTVNARLWDAIRFLWSSGNFEAAGTIKMYALKRAG